MTERGGEAQTYSVPSWGISPQLLLLYLRVKARQRGVHYKRSVSVGLPDGLRGSAQAEEDMQLRLKQSMSLLSL